MIFVERINDSYKKTADVHTFQVNVLEKNVILPVRTAM